MDGLTLFAGLALLLVLAGIVTAVAILMWPARSSDPRRYTRSDRAKNQAEVEEWIARTKGQDHVKRMRGDD